MPISSANNVPEELIRRVHVVRGRVPFHLECRPAFDDARVKHETHVGEHGVRFDAPGLSLGLASPVPLRRHGEGVAADLTLDEGEKATFLLRRLGAHDDSVGCPGSRSQLAVGRQAVLSRQSGAVARGAR